MKTFLLILSVLIILGIIIIVLPKMKNASTSSNLATNSTTKSFMENYTASPNALLIDIRTPEEFNSGHIKGALNINFYDADFIEQVKKVAADKDLFIYCRSGARSGNAKAQLQKEGFTVEDLAGGISSHPELLAQ